MKTGSYLAHSTRFRTLIASLALPVAAFAFSSCKSNEAPPPLPVAKPAPAPSVANIAPEEEAADAGTQKAEKKVTSKGGGGSGGALGACCKALRQNAASAPPETQGHLLNAATMCDAANKQGLGKATGFLSALGGASIPTACK
jgi:hypothetical protein